MFAYALKTLHLTFCQFRPGVCEGLKNVSGHVLLETMKNVAFTGKAVILRNNCLTLVNMKMYNNLIGQEVEKDVLSYLLRGEHPLHNTDIH